MMRIGKETKALILLVMILNSTIKYGNTILYEPFMKAENIVRNLPAIWNQNPFYKYNII
jgi:hypothetical protein